MRKIEQNLLWRRSRIWESKMYCRPYNNNQLDTSHFEERFWWYFRATLRHIYDDGAHQKYYPNGLLSFIKAAIAQWIRLHLPSCRHRFEPKHAINAFINLYLNCHVEKDENKQKRGRDWPIFLKKNIALWSQSIEQNANKFLTYTSNARFLTVFFKKWPTSASFSFIFSIFKQTLQFFKTNICEKMSIQYMVPGFEPTTFGTWVSSHNH